MCMDTSTVVRLLPARDTNHLYGVFAQASGRSITRTAVLASGRRMLDLLIQHKAPLRIYATTAPLAYRQPMISHHGAVCGLVIGQWTKGEA